MLIQKQVWLLAIAFCVIFNPSRKQALMIDQVDPPVALMIDKIYEFSSTDRLLIEWKHIQRTYNLRSSGGLKVEGEHAQRNHVHPSSARPMIQAKQVQRKYAIRSSDRLMIEGEHKQSKYAHWSSERFLLKQNRIGAMQSEMPERQDGERIIFNEIMFNPPPGSVDYIELYNNSGVAIDLSGLYIAGRDAAGQLSHLKALRWIQELFFPGEYRVITSDAEKLREKFQITDPSVIIELSGMPAMPNDKGTIVLLTSTEEIIDELRYDHTWHFPLIWQEEGVALERLDPMAATQHKSNWASASASSGYGTPGSRNSQARSDRSDPAGRGVISVTPAVISPDNDGYDDQAIIQYNLSAPAQVANIIIFNISGTPVRYLARNLLLGIEGRVRWDGLDERNRPVPAGSYIVYTEIFGSAGRGRKFKNAVAVVRN